MESVDMLTREDAEGLTDYVNPIQLRNIEKVQVFNGLDDSKMIRSLCWICLPCLQCFSSSPITSPII